MLARYQFAVTDSAGNILPGASVDVRAETTGAPLAALYSDRAGTVSLGNPIIADSEGFVYFHVVGGAYKIVATSGSASRTWRYVGIGLTSESDALIAGVAYVFSTAAAAADPGAGYLRLNNATPASVTAVYLDNLAVSTADVSAWLDTWDDGGSTADRGVLILQNSAGTKLFIGKVTGSVVDSTGYRTITVSHTASVGAFDANETLQVIFCRAGVDGTGDVNGPASATSGNLASFGDTTGKLLADSGIAATVGQGKQILAWVPAGAMIANTTNGPASVSAEMTTNKNMVKSLDFDATTSESAQFSVRMPKKWNESTITFVPVWTHAATTTNFGVVWELSGVATSNDDTLDVAFGTGQQSADTGGTTYDQYSGPESSAITIGGTPAELDVVNFRIARLPADGADTMAIDAKLIGVTVYYTTNAVTEA